MESDSAPTRLWVVLARAFGALAALTAAGIGLSLITLDEAETEWPIAGVVGVWFLALAVLGFTWSGRRRRPRSFWLAFLAAFGVYMATFIAVSFLPTNEPLTPGQTLYGLAVITVAAALGFVAVRSPKVAESGSLPPQPGRVEADPLSQFGNRDADRQGIGRAAFIALVITAAVIAIMLIVR